jgi:type VI secretion system protein ImpK
LLRHQLRGCVEELLRRAEDAGFSQRDTQDMAYAVAALMDEVMLARPEPHQRFWLNNPLQRHFFQESAAGEGFFHRLQQLRAAPHRREVLRVYYLCLVFGFQGRYHSPVGELELMRLAHAVRDELAQGLVHPADELSPHGGRPPDPPPQEGGRAPSSRLLAGVVVLVVLFFCLGLRIYLASQSSSVATRMATAASQVRTKE